MAIKFICSCGKHLRARDEMAARRSVCPACGEPVGIPSLRPTHRGGTPGPLSFVERQRSRQRTAPVGVFAQDSPPAAPEPESPDGPTDAAPTAARRRPLDLGLVRLVVGRKHHHAHRREKGMRWYHGLVDAVRTLPLLLGLTTALATFTAGTVLLLPELNELLLPWWPWLLVPLPIAGYACDLLQSALGSALTGQGASFGWRGRSVGHAVKSCATWLICFLAGPVVPAGGSVFYWVYCGDPDLLDWLIVAELAVLAIGYWLLVLLSVGQSGRLLDVNPLRVADLVDRHGHRLVVGALGGSVVLLAHGLVGLVAVAQLHRDVGVGWLLLFGCWLSGLLSCAFLFRLLGGWCRASR
ncbi:MAG TPA: hypothetical protein VG013_14140 [Gemmataceae bacterium]|jgi:hypothetical protein|nr:hypothetical protein [Gemmataceae bacterium]